MIYFTIFLSPVQRLETYLRILLLGFEGKTCINKRSLNANVYFCSYFSFYCNIHLYILYCHITDVLFKKYIYNCHSYHKPYAERQQMKNGYYKMS